MVHYVGYESQCAGMSGKFTCTTDPKRVTCPQCLAVREEEANSKLQAKMWDADYAGLDSACPKCGHVGAYGFKVIDEDHADEKQRCFACGFSQYVGPETKAE